MTKRTTKSERVKDALDNLAQLNNTRVRLEIELASCSQALEETKYRIAQATSTLLRETKTKRKAKAKPIPTPSTGA